MQQIKGFYRSSVPTQNTSVAKGPTLVHSYVLFLFLVRSVIIGYSLFLSIFFNGAGLFKTLPQWVLSGAHTGAPLQTKS